MIYLKALHLIFVVTWFAGLFYIVRLMIYHMEALESHHKHKQILIQQYSLMERRLWYIITWPSAILTLVLGLSQLHQFFPLQENPWLQSKLVLLVFLYLYHFQTGRYLKRLWGVLENPSEKMKSSSFFRIWNEVSTLFLFAIVFLAVLKDNWDALKTLLLVFGLMIVLFVAIILYKKNRQKK